MRVENSPALDGAYIVVGNHTSFLDPLLIGSVCRRRITFLMTVVVFRSAILGWFYRVVRSIPLSLRGPGNRDALRAARAVLKRGEVLGVFPEGGISRDGQMMRGNPGAVALVLAENVPVVPVFLHGAGAILPLGCILPRLFLPVHIRFGDPIAQSALLDGAPNRRRDRLEFATQRIMDAVATLGGEVSRESWLERRAAARVNRA